MKTSKLNFTMPGEIAERLKARVEKRKRSAFVAEAVHEKLKELEREQLRKELAEGYRAQREEAEETDREWEAATLENWPQ